MLVTVRGRVRDRDRVRDRVRVRVRVVPVMISTKANAGDVSVPAQTVDARVSEYVSE